MDASEKMVIAACPRCGYLHEVEIEPASSVQVRCKCGKQLKFERAEHGRTLVVSEQIEEHDVGSGLPSIERWQVTEVKPE